MIKAYEAADRLREKLSQGETKFVFKKKDGTIRPAVGTTNLDLVPQDLWPKDMSGDYEEREKQSTNIKFFDLDKLAWRSCNENSIKSIDGEDVE